MRRGTLQMVMTVLSACAAGAVLAGCTSDPGAPPPTTPPATSAAPSPSATPTPTPTPDAATPPERPDMSQVDTETAEAVAVYFIQLFPYAAATGDLTEWNRLSHPDCVFCADVRTEIEGMASRGHRSEGGLIHIGEVSTTQVSADWWLVTLHVVQEPSTTRDSAGVVVEDFPETKALRLDVAIVPTNGLPTVREVDSTRED